MSQEPKTYVERINEIHAKIVAIKSSECIMDYDSKTEQINKLKNMMDSLASAESMMMLAGR